MTRVDLEAAERMLNKATPGPWTSVYDAIFLVAAPPCGTEWLVRSPTRAVLGVAYYDGDRAMGSEPDCALVAAAPTLIRALIEEVRGLREAMPTDEERIAIGNRLRHDYDRRYPGDALVDHVKAIDWLARIEAARSR